MDLAKHIDHTLLKIPTALSEAVNQLSRCESLGIRGFVSFPWIIAEILKNGYDGKVILASVIDFPSGTSSIEAKLAEIEYMYELGCMEFDVVLNTSALVSGKHSYFEDEMAKIIDIGRAYGITIKTIVEIEALNRDEFNWIIETANMLKPDYLKTSTGRGPGSPSPEIVSQIRSRLDSSIMIKASGGIRSYEQAIQYIEAGASLIGSSRGIEIIASLRGGVHG